MATVPPGAGTGEEEGRKQGQKRRILGNAAAQVDGLKRSLADAHRQLALQSRHLVFDMVYRAGGETPLLADARQAGARTVDGLSLLLHQGAISFEHWFDRPAPLKVMREGLQNAGRS